jgi:hypothetical protein
LHHSIPGNIAENNVSRTGQLIGPLCVKACYRNWQADKNRNIQLHILIIKCKFENKIAAETSVILHKPMIEKSRRIEAIHIFYLVCEATGTAGTPGLLSQPRVIVKMIVEKQMEFRLAGETEVLGENLPWRHFFHHTIPHDQTRV